MSVNSTRLLPYLCIGGIESVNSMDTIELLSLTSIVNGACAARRGEDEQPRASLPLLAPTSTWCVPRACSVQRLRELV